MTTTELLKELSEHGVRVMVDGADLVLRGPVRRLPPGTVDHVRECKQEIIAALIPIKRPARPTRADLLRTVGDAAQAIHRHCEICKTCPEPSAFGTIIAPIGCCDEGRRLWKVYRQAHKQYLGVN